MDYDINGVVTRYVIKDAEIRNRHASTRGIFSSGIIKFIKKDHPDNTKSTFETVEDTIEDSVKKIVEVAEKPIESIFSPIMHWVYVVQGYLQRFSQFHYLAAWFITSA